MVSFHVLCKLHVLLQCLLQSTSRQPVGAAECRGVQQQYDAKHKACVAKQNMQMVTDSVQQNSS